MPLAGPVLYAGAIWLGAYPDNFMVGRQGQAATGILDHHSASTLDGLVARFTQSSGVSGGGVSAHFAIDRDGTRYQFVDTADTAFHAGNFAANLAKIGIEHVRQWGSGPGTPGYEPITDAQYQSSHELHAILAADNGIPLDLTHVEPHNHYTQTTCPGDLDLNRIITGGDLMTFGQKQAAIIACWTGMCGATPPDQGAIDAWATKIADDGSNMGSVIGALVNEPYAVAYRNAVQALIKAGPGQPGKPGKDGVSPSLADIASHLKLTVI